MKAVKLGFVSGLILVFTISCQSPPEKPSGFQYLPAGDLVPPESGVGRADEKLYAPNIRFPIESPPAYVNSQVWGVGGLEGPSGDQCAPVNYSYPWKDNYCERRDHPMPLCPAGTGHQGVDIRPASCEKDRYWAVAVENGKVSHIGHYSLFLRGEETGTIYRYLHINVDRLAPGIQFGAVVSKGQRLGLVSNYFSGTPTTIHLHFDMKQSILTDNGTPLQVFVPPYTSLVSSYERLLAE